MTKLFITSLLLTLVISAQPVLEKVKSLNPEKLESTIECYYSAEYHKYAVEISKTLGNATSYFENTFDLNETFAVAVLNKSDWEKITNIPYGLPFVSGPPYIVCFPAGINNELGSLVRRALAKSNLPEQYNISIDELAYQFISLIGFHELGHIYSKACGISFPNKWTFEFAATYFAYLYLENTSPEKNKLWVEVGNAILEVVDPKYKSLKDFEELYVKVGVENYAWYQVVFLNRVAETAENTKESFISKLASKNLSNENYSLNDLEKIDNGFLKWAENNNLLSQ